MNAAANTPPSERPSLVLPATEAISLTPSGVEALADCYSPRECDLCRKPLAKGDAYYRVTLGMDETPSHIGTPIALESSVEDLSELIVCASCEPAVAVPLSELLSVIWALRRPSPLDDEPETERSVETAS